MALLDGINSTTSFVSKASTYSSLSSSLSSRSSLSSLRLSSESTYASALDKVSSRLSDLNSISSNIDKGSQIVKAGEKGADSIKRALEQAGKLAQAALSGSESARKSLAEEFNTLLKQIDNTAADSSYEGANLLQGASVTLQVGGAGSTYSLSSFSVSSSSLGLSSASGAWKNDSDIAASLTSVYGYAQAYDMLSQMGKEDALDASSKTDEDSSSSATDAGMDMNAASSQTGALSFMRYVSNSFSVNLSALDTRAKLNKEYTSAIKAGASDIVADPLAQSGDSSSLSLLTQTSITPLSFATQAAKAVESLFK